MAHSCGNWETDFLPGTSHDTREQINTRQSQLHCYAAMDAGSEAVLSPLDGEGDSSGDNMFPDPGMKDLAEIADNLFNSLPGRPQLSQSKNRGVCSMLASEADAIHPLDGGAVALAAFQKKDPKILTPLTTADQTSSRFATHHNLLYRRVSLDNSEQTTYQLRLLASNIPAVPKVAHCIPLAGHMGESHRKLQRFYWSGLHKDVQDQCPDCQRTARYQHH